MDKILIDKILEEMESNQLNLDLARLVAMHRLAESRKEKMIAEHLEEIAIKFIAYFMFYVDQNPKVQALALKEAEQIFHDGAKKYKQYINNLTERVMGKLMEDKTSIPDLEALVKSCIE